MKEIFTFSEVGWNMELDLFDEQLGKRIRKARSDAGLSQKSFCEKIGISQTQLSGYETGHRNPGLHTLVKMSNLLKVSLDYLCCGEEKSNGKNAKSIKKGELITKSLLTLRENGIVFVESSNNFNISNIVFYNYEVEQTYIKLFDDIDYLEKNIQTYSDPISFREQLINSAANKIDIILDKEKKQR